MIHSLSEAFARPPPSDFLDAASLTNGLAADGPSAAGLKKAFHRASRSLHPDRLRELPTARRAEAEEVFKVLSAAYHHQQSSA